MEEASETMQEYFNSLVSNINEAHSLAVKARAKNLDPHSEVEISLAKNMAERVLGLISMVAPQIKNTTMVERIQQLEAQYGILDWRVAFVIAEEIALEKFCKFKDKKEAIEVGIRTGFAYITSGVVSSCLEGFTHLEIKPRRDGKGQYFTMYFSGPIRNAGGTAAAVSVLIADYVRKKLGYAKYDPDEKEIARTFAEVDFYNERCVRVQYMPSKEELDFLTMNVPIEVSGDPTERVEVPNYKNLPRISTNLIRSGFGLIYSSCIPLKAPKLWKALSKWGKDFDMEQWDFLEEFLKIQKTAKSKGKKEDDQLEKPKIAPIFTYIADLVGGRPVLGHPLEKGGFRLRYGRSRISGLSGQSVHPATMHIANDFIAIGTQLKLERPGKAAVYSSCDTIEGPIVRLKNGNVVRVETEDQAKSIKKEVERIIFLGDVLICYGDFFNRAHPLVPAGYCEEWWVQELEKSIVDTFGALDLEKAANFTKIDLRILESIVSDAQRNIPSCLESLKLSTYLKVPFHPYHLFHWKDVSAEDFNLLIKHLQKAQVEKNEEKVSKIIVSYDADAKRVLECLGIPHLVATDYLVIEKDSAFALYIQLNKFDFAALICGGDPLESINKPSKFIFRDKSGTYIGSRMGRPEKAKMRKMKGSPHGLFPIGEEGGRMRSIQAALKNGQVNSSFPLLKCGTCDRLTIYPKCEQCGQLTKQLFHCHKCGVIKEPCEHEYIQQYTNRPIDMRHYFNDALNILKTTIYPDLIKGIKGTVNKEHYLEHLAKSILRAKHNVHVNKDGTIRYDATEIPVTHFKPKEVAVSIEKLKELGYVKDIKGNELIDQNQILEIKCQDVILPCCPEIETPADQVLLNTANFVDEMLEKFYGLPRFFNCKTREDLVGHIIVALAPHTSAGTAARIVGFSKSQGLIAHPLLHCACRRDCVDYGTKFAYSYGDNSFEYGQIGNFVEKLIDKKGLSWKNKNSLKIKPDSEMFVFGIDLTSNKFKKKKVKYFMKNSAPDFWVKVKTGTGREMVMTDNHKFIFFEDKEMKIKRAKDIKVGDGVPLSRHFNPSISKKKTFNLVELLYENLPSEERKNVFVITKEGLFKSLLKPKRTEMMKLFGISSKSLGRWYRKMPLEHFKRLIDVGMLDYSKLSEVFLRTNHSLDKFDLLLDMDEDLAELLGYYVAEGYFRKNKTVSQVAFRIDNRQIQRRISKLVASVFGVRPSLGEEGTKITICHKLVYYLFKYCFNVGKGAYEKRAPHFILNADDKIIKKFISAYFDGDGSAVPQRNALVFYSVSKSLLDDIALLLSRFGIFGRYSETAPRLPGKTVLENYEKLNRSPKRHVLFHLTYFGQDAYDLSRLICSNIYKKCLTLNKIKKNLSSRRKTIFGGSEYELTNKGDILIDYVKSVEILNDTSPSYCLEIESSSELDKNILWGEQIINARCDGDELGFFLLMDGFLNFSKRFLPQSRGGTMDAPLVLTSVIDPTGVDDMVFDMDVAWTYPLALYNSALEYKMPWELKIEQVNSRLRKPSQYEGYGFTHDNGDFNAGVLISSYKTLPTMKDKLVSQMDVAEKIRAVDTSDVASLVINKHFLKDTKGNLRKFSQQQFRCVSCNEKFRRPPLSGKCSCSKSKIIFTISEGSVIKYLAASLEIAEKHKVPQYIQQTLDILKLRVDSYFGKDKEKQEGLNKWFGEV